MRRWLSLSAKVVAAMVLICSIQSCTGSNVAKKPKTDPKTSKKPLDIRANIEAAKQEWKGMCINFQKEWGKGNQDVIINKKPYDLNNDGKKEIIQFSYAVEDGPFVTMAINIIDKDKKQIFKATISDAMPCLLADVDERYPGTEILISDPKDWDSDDFKGHCTITVYGWDKQAKHYREINSYKTVNRFPLQIITRQDDVTVYKDYFELAQFDELADYLTVKSQTNLDSLLSPSKNVAMDLKQTDYAGLQLFVSYGGGNPNEQATWPRIRGYGQITKCAPSDKGLWLLKVDFVETDTLVEKNNKRRICEEGGVGIFDPGKQIIYWIRGYPKNDYIYVDNPQWFGEKISFTAISLSRYDEFERKETVQVTPQLLAESIRDYTPRVAHFGYQLLEALMNNADLEPLLTKVAAKDREKVKSYIGRYRQRITDTFSVSWVGYSMDAEKKGQPPYTLDFYGAPRKGEVSGGVADAFGHIELRYDERKDLFMVKDLYDPWWK